MIKWEGFFRDQQYNSKYKVEIINSDGDEKVEVPQLTTLFGVELDKGEYSCFVKLDPNDPFCSHSTDIGQIGYDNYVVYVVVEKERDTVYFNAVNDNITIIGEQGELPIQHTYQCTVLKLEGNTNYIIDGEHYFSNHEYLCYETQSEDHEIIKCRNYSFRELMLEGDSPVIVRYEGDDEDVFKSVRYSECTIKLLTNWYDEDLFSKRTTDNKVSIYMNTADEDEEEDYTLKWTGYLTPNVYSQGFAYDIEGLELNAVDSLAVLKNKRFEGKKKARSASKILHDMLKNEISTIFMSDTIKVGDVIEPHTEIDGFTILDYITTDGTAYIDTHYSACNLTFIETTASINYENATDYATLFGAASYNHPQAQGLDRRCQLIVRAFNFNQYNNRYYSYFTANFSYSHGIMENINIATPTLIQVGNINGQIGTPDSAFLQVGDTNNIKWYANVCSRSDRSLYLFGQHVAHAPNTSDVSEPFHNCAGMTLGRFKIYEWEEVDGEMEKVLKMDLVPVKRNSDSMLGFYNVMTNEFLTTTQGAFIQGSPAEDSNSTKELSRVDFSQSLDLNKLILSDYQFYDEDNKEWDFSNKILEEMCKYLCMTAVVQGNYLYIIDLADKVNNFQVYNRTSNDYQRRPYGVTIRYTKDWNADDYVDDGTQISMNPVYNQLKLENKLDDFKNLTDNLFLRKNLTNLYGERYKVDEGSQFDNDNQNVVIWEREPLISKDCKMYMWNNTSISNIPITAMIQDPEEYIKNTTVPTILADTNKNFAMLCKCADLYYNVNSRPQTEYHAQSMGDKSDFIMMTNNHMNQDHQKMLEMSLNSDSIVQTTKAYYIINFNVLFSTEYFPCTSLKKKTTKNMLEGFNCDGDGKISYNSLYIMARMQYGDKYWNGSSWQSQECDFKISLETSANYVEALNTTLNVNNQVDFKTGLELSGYIVPIPIESSASIGSVKLSFPHYQYISSDIKAVFLSNLEVNLTMKKKDKEEIDDDNIIKQEIDKTFAEEKELDSCEFSTFDETHLSYNTVGYDVDGDYFILDVVKYGDWILKMEQIRLLKYALQFSHPRKTVDITLRNIYGLPYYKFTNWNFGEITFIPNSYSLDFKNNSTSLKLIEKR